MIKEQKWIFFIALGRQYFLEYFKALNLDHFCQYNYVWHVPVIKNITPFVLRDDISDVIKALEETGEKLVNWFSNNEVKPNTDKCHLLLNRQESNTFKIGDLHINNCLSEKLLGISLHYKFHKRIKDICQKASQNLNALARAAYMETIQKRSPMNALFKSQFNYCLLGWMYCKRSLSTKINRLHKRCFWINYNDKKSNFNELLVKDSSVSIHHQNLQKLAVEMFKVCRV